MIMAVKINDKGEPVMGDWNDWRAIAKQLYTDIQQIKNDINHMKVWIDELRNQ